MIQPENYGYYLILTTNPAILPTYTTMKVAGFTFIRNANIYDYPIVEAITSILPLCDEFVVAVGNSEDDTLDLIRNIPTDKIRIVETVWDDSLREGGKVLAQETDKALAAISPDVDWAFYIQGDEVMHETYIPVVKQAMETYLANSDVEGLLFNYLHFYGSYNYYGNSRRWYRREVRIVRPFNQVYAYRDAQGFRRSNNKKLRVKLIDAYIYHYGWVKSLEKIKKKYSYFYRFWHSDEQMNIPQKEAENFQFAKHIDSLALFNGSHPAVMQERIKRENIQFDFDTRQQNYSTRVKVLAWVERLTGWRIGEYKNYKII